MELTDKDRAVIVDLINIAWQAGAIKAPRVAQEVENLRQRLITKPEPVEEAKGE